MREEILPLNILRFFAALCVFYTHKFEMLLSLGYLPAFMAFLSPFAQYGYLGVDLFFIISGFVITLSSEGRSARQFISARFIRLFPAFWICVSITTLAIILLRDTQHVSLAQYVANLTMNPVYFGSHAFIDSVYWSLGVELKFYFLMVLFLMLGSFIKVDIQKIALFLTVPLLINTLLYLTKYDIKSTLSISFFTAFFFHNYWSGYAQNFIAGILFYGLYQNRKRHFHYLAIFLCYFVSIVQTLDPSRSYVTNNKIILLSCVTVFFLLFFLVSLRLIKNTTFTFLGKNYRKIVITLGAITYPLYLLHNVTVSVLLETLSAYKIPAYIASPVLFTSLILLILIVNKIDLYITNLWKRKPQLANF